jgi:TonB family protein
LIGSAVMHLLLAVSLVVVARGANGPPPVVYSVRLLAAPRPSETPRRAAEAAIPVAEQRDMAPPDKPVVKPQPGETPSTGTDAITFRQDGIRFQYPEYLERVIVEIRRRWVNPSGASKLQATVDFTIERNGSVTGVRLAKSSGDFTFNTEALGAVERAGRDGAFGPLPDGFNGESLPIAFTFKPEIQ